MAALAQRININMRKLSAALGAAAAQHARQAARRINEAQ